MKIKTAQVSISRTVNLDSYENAKFSIVLEVESDEESGAVTEADLATAWEIAREQIKAEAAPVLEARRRIRGKRWQQVLGNLPKDLREMAEQVLSESQRIEEEDRDDQVGTE